MDSLQEYLLELSDRLDTDGKKVCADAVDDLIKTASLQKLAQYVGVIGYVLKQNRAMGNCIRKKRAASSDSMQNVVLQCLKEYQDGQNYQDTEWASKYAQVIQQDPQKFDVSHLFFLSTVGEMGDITQHIKQVEKVANLFEENDVEEPIFNTVLGHLSTFGDILSKDSETHANFKVAAPPRGGWSRWWNPTQFSLMNPRSWFKGVRERGQDLDAIQELESVLTNLSALTRITQQIRTQMARLKAEANGYTAGSGSELWPGGSGSRYPRQEQGNVIDSLVSKINDLEPNDWNRSMLLLQQMRYLLKNSTPENQYNKQIYNRASQSIDRVFSSMEEVYSLLETIQGDMETLRTREPILGRDSGLTEEGRRNPFGISSPAEEYGALQQVLEKLYENPMNPKAQWYAQKAHARLWDKLRYIERGSDEGMNEWLQSPVQEPPKPSGLEEFNAPEDEIPGASPTPSPITPEPEATEPPLSEPSERPAGVSGDVDEWQQADFERLKKQELDELSQKQDVTINDVLDVIHMIALILDGPAQDAVFDLENDLRRKIDNPDVDMASGPSTGGPVSPVDVDIEGGSVPFGDDEPRIASLNTGLLIKIADAVDRINPDIATVLDALIQEQKGNKIDAMFPEFSVPVKEHAIEEKNNTI